MKRGRYINREEVKLLEKYKFLVCPRLVWWLVVLLDSLHIGINVLQDCPKISRDSMDKVTNLT